MPLRGCPKLVLCVVESSDSSFYLFLYFVTREGVSVMVSGGP